MSIKNLQINDLYWIAGLLEGEGCFRKRSEIEGTERRVIILCNMTDVDVLEKLQGLVGGNLNGPYTNGDILINKLRWCWTLNGHKAYLLMKKLLPLMGDRRQKKIRKLIKGYESLIYYHQILCIKTGKILYIRNRRMRQWCRKKKISDGNLYRTKNGNRSHTKGFRLIA